MYRVTGTLLSGGRGHESQVAQEPPPPSPEWYHPLNTDKDTHVTVKTVSLLGTPTVIQSECGFNFISPPASCEQYRLVGVL